MQAAAASCRYRSGRKTVEGSELTYIAPGKFQMGSPKEEKDRSENEFQHEVDGKVVAETVGPGGMLYIAFGTRHAVSNAGPGQARYFVVEIGGDA